MGPTLTLAIIGAVREVREEALPLPLPLPLPPPPPLPPPLPLPLTSRADLRNVANPMAAGGEAEQVT